MNLVNLVSISYCSIKGKSCKVLFFEFSCYFEIKVYGIENMEDVLTLEQRKWLANPDNLLSYAKLCLKIRKKSGYSINLNINTAQQYLHKELEKQRKKEGKVRAIVVKGRQQGCSTYIAARFYHRVTNSLGTRCFIMAHERSATENLFNMVENFHKYCPEPVKAQTSVNNAKELTFDDLEGSGYKVGTAGSKQSGRSQTIQLFHGSEMAFWENAPELFAGVLQAVPDADGSEIILESTANGMGNKFYELAQEAMQHGSEYKLIFLAWYWQDEYKKKLPEEFYLTEEEQAYKSTYGLNDEQMYWRRTKIKELGDWRFKQEYPGNVTEAFQADTDEVLIKADAIIKARKASFDNTNSYAPLVLGVDPSWQGKDRSVIAYRRGREVEKVEVIDTNDTMVLTGKICQVIDELKPVKVFLDVIGIGGPIYDRLAERGYVDRVIKVIANSVDLDNPERFKNKRAEMWCNMKEWLEGEVPVRIPDNDAIQADMMKPKYFYDSNSKIQLESKQDMRGRGIKSPDLADAIALTFAYKLNINEIEGGNLNRMTKITKKKPKFANMRY